MIHSLTASPTYPLGNRTRVGFQPSTATSAPCDGLDLSPRVSGMAGLLLSENPRISRAELIAELKERCFTPEPTTATPPTAKESLESAHVIGTLLGMGRDTGPRDDSFLMSIHPAGSHRAQPAQGQDLSLSYSLPGYEQFFSDARPF